MIPPGRRGRRGIEPNHRIAKEKALSLSNIKEKEANAVIRREGNSILQISRYKLIVAGLAIIVFFLVIARDFTMQTVSAIKDDATVIVDTAGSEEQEKATVRQDTPAPSRQTQDEIKSADKLVSATDTKSFQSLKEEQVSEVEENDTMTLPSAAIPRQSGQVTAGQSSSGVMESVVTSQPAEIESTPLSLPQPTTLELAEAALKESNYQTAMDIHEADSKDITTKNPEYPKMYSQALAGRAATIIGQSPAEAQSLLLKAVSVDPQKQ